MVEIKVDKREKIHKIKQNNEKLLKEERNK